MSAFQVSFIEDDAALWAYLPPGQSVYRLDEADKVAPGCLSAKQRGFARVLLNEALRLLNEAESE